MRRLKKVLRACLKTTSGAVVEQKAGWRDATKENIPCGSSTEEQRSQTAFCSTTLRAAGLLAVGGVGSLVTARFGDAGARAEAPSPPWPQPKSFAAAPLVVFKQALNHRLGGAILVAVLFLVFSFATRIVLLLKTGKSADWGPFALAETFFWGGLFDLITATYLALPVACYFVLIPQKVFSHRFHRWLMLLGFGGLIYALIFVGAAEYFFWGEFGTRFNFIAVDYLIYTTEVLGNIQESYPLPFILSAILVLSLFCLVLLSKLGLFDPWLGSSRNMRKELAGLFGAGLVGACFTLLVTNESVPNFKNSFNQELARNGPYSFVAAFRNNQLDYQTFYPTQETEQCFKNLRNLLHSDGVSFDSEDPVDITRHIKSRLPEKRWNVIQITVESLSAKFLGVFGNQDNLTPRLDELAREGVLFTSFFATGNRTDRGMEALTLSVPPTPGRSIVKRSNNENLFSLGSVFQSRGYETAFIYSGFGYFDNMNYFFSHNGYRVIDRTTVPKKEITFANVWGACDEDLFSWVLKEADDAFERGKPFFHFVMTTSNHRPFTYPEGRIDIPSHTGRKGAVKYTDFAIGELIRKARSKPWFNNTLFVIVADHCASSSGKTELPVNGYHIPLLIYNAHLLPAQKVEKVCSQIDYAPSLLSLLGWSYDSRFFGKDIFTMQSFEERALFGNYQKLGYLKDNELTILKPVKQHVSRKYDPITGNLSPPILQPKAVAEAISYYQAGGYLFDHRLNRALP